jgi:FAD/FMN-containing dehydrogenase
VQDALAALIGPENLRPATDRTYLEDATAIRGLRGQADAVALPGSVDEVASVMGWCYENDVPIVPRGGSSASLL